MKKFSLALILLSLLSACADDPMPTPKLDYALPPKINLDVQRLTLVDHSTAPVMGAVPGVGRFQPSIADAVRQWATDRLQAAGASGDGEIVIRDASLTTQALPIEHGFSSWFTRQQASKFTARAEVDVSVRGQAGFAEATAEATRYESLPEDASEAEKKKAYFDVLNALMRDLGRNLEGSINEHMQGFIITAPLLKDGGR